MGGSQPAPAPTPTPAPTPPPPARTDAQVQSAAKANVAKYQGASSRTRDVLSSQGSASGPNSPYWLKPGGDPRSSGTVALLGNVGR